MNPLDAFYSEIIDPTNFIKNFPDMDGFRLWLKQGDINDFKSTMNVFDNHELYEHCIVIQEVIDQKVDIMLSGLGFD